MYDELIKRLRNDAKAFTGFVNEDLLKAADAIEDLQKQLQKSEVDNINLTGWLAEEHAKHLWIPVTERLPETHGHYFIWVARGKEKLIGYDDIGYFGRGKFSWEHISQEQPEEVTHWMPLPEPPKEET